MNAIRLLKVGRLQILFCPTWWLGVQTVKDFRFSSGPEGSHSFYLITICIIPLIGIVWDWKVY